MIQGYKRKAQIMADEMRAYDPTMRERMASALQGGMEGMGVNRAKARKHAQTVMGGDSSNLPMGLGIADFVPFVGTSMGLEEGARDLGHAYDAVKRGDYIDAAADTAGAAMGLIPGGYSTIKTGKNMLKKLKTIDLPQLKLIETDSVPKKKQQSLKEWAMAGGGVPQKYKGREHVWHKKVHKMAAGGEVFNTVPDLSDGGQIIEGQAYAKGGAVKKAVKDAVEGVVDGLKPVVDRINMHFKDVTKRVPELQEGAQKVKGEEMTRAEYEKLVNKYKPVKPYEFVPKPATRDEAYNALNADKRDLYGTPSSMLKAGHPVGLRLDIPSYSDHGVWVPAIHEQDAGFKAGDRIGYESIAGVMNPTFGMHEHGALNIAAGKPKSTIATIKGEWNPMDETTAVARAQEYLDHPEWRQVGMDPERHSYFYDRATMQPITAAEEAIQIGPLVLAKKPQYGNKKDFKYAEGGEVHMAKGGKAKDAVKAGLKKLFGVADEAPKGVEPIIVRTPEERAVIDKFGQKQEQEAVRQKKVEKAAKQSAGQSPEDQVAKPAKSTGRRVAVPPDVYRKMAEDQGDEAVLRAARAGKHLKPTNEGYIGAPRTVTSGQGLGAMRRAMDTDFADSVDAVRLADPERLGTWYDRAKQGIAESTEPYQLPRTLEQHGVYSAGVSPESELTFSVKHQNSRVAGNPQMAYRGAGMRNLDEAVAEGRPANMGFKIGEYAEKNDPRVPNAGLFGVNDFRRAQGMGYTDPQGNPWKAGVSDTMHPFMDAETALQVDRANAAGTGGRTDWAGPHIQEVPWVYGKAQDLYGRGQKGRYKGDELEGIKSSIQDANNTARDYFYKHAGSSTHEAIPGANTGHVPSMLDAPFEEKVAYGNVGRWDVPAPEYALSDMGTVGAGNRDAIYSALGYRQLPTIEASGAYFPEGSKVAEHQPVKIARPLLDFPTGGGGIVSEPTRQTMEFAERFRALGDAQEAFGFNLPNTMADVKGKNSLVLDTRGANPRYLDEPHTGVMPDEKQMGALTQALSDTGYGVAPTSRGATVFPFDSKATAADARRLMKEKGSALQQIYPSEMEPSLNTSGYGPGVGMYTPDGFKATEPFSGQATMGLLKEASYLPPEVAMNLGESERVRSQLKAKMKRDEALPNARADIQETRRFFSEADWPKAVALIRQGYTPAAALAALGYSASSMAEERR